jgi:hypothetical protein
MDKQDYNNKALQQLVNTKYNQQITNSTNETIIKETINRYKITTSNDLTSDQKQQLIKYTRPIQKYIRFPRIYFNPKTHKPNNPLRPIISGINWATENVAEALNEALKPIIYSKPHIPSSSSKS